MRTPRAKRRLFLILVLSIFMGSGMILSCGKGSEFKIGLLVPKSGKGADWGLKQEIAAKAAVEEINAQGGVYGRKIKLIIRDTKGDNKRAVHLMSELATGKGVLAILGPFFNEEVEEVFYYANLLQIPIISASSTTPGISQKYRPWTFRNTMTDDKSFSAAIPKFKRLYNIKTVAIMVNAGDSWARELGFWVLPPILKENDIKILNEKDKSIYFTGNKDFSTDISKIKAMNPDGIIIAGYHEEAANIIKEARRQGMRQPFLGGIRMYSDALIRHGGEAVEGTMVVSSFWAENPDAKVQAFVNKFGEKANSELVYTGSIPPNPSPTPFDANIYDTVYILFQIIKSNGITGDKGMLQGERTKIRDALENLKKFQGASGLTSINKFGDGVKEVYTLIIKNGKYERFD